MSKKYYEQYWEELKLVPGAHLQWKARILSALKLSGKNLLDVGCGNGELAAVLLDRFEVFGADISDNALLQAARIGVKTSQFDANRDQLPYPDKSFDNVMCLDVLEHILDPVAFLKEISRVLAQGGTLLVCVPNILNVFNRLSFVLGEFSDVMDVAHKNGELFSEHIRLFSKNKLETLLKNEGYLTLKKYFYFPEFFTEKRWKNFQLAGLLVNKLRLAQIFPSFFALGFLYVCQKTPAHKQSSSMIESIAYKPFKVKCKVRYECPDQLYLCNGSAMSMTFGCTNKVRL